MLVALGMTLVIATRGIDLSVGAVMAVSGAVALTIIDGSADPSNLGVVVRRRRRRDLVALLLGVLERLPRRGARHPADHRHAGAHARRPRRGLLITDGLITTVNSPPFEFIATGYLLGCRSPSSSAVGFGRDRRA